MLELSSAQIAAAKDGDMDAVTTVLKELAPRITYAARDAATVAGHLDRSLVDDYSQEANIAVLLALPNFKGESAGQLSRFMDRYINEAVTDARRDESRKGVDYEVSGFARHTYERALSKAQGSHDAAEKFAQDAELFGKNALSPETARLARQACARIEYLDAPVDEGTTLLETLTNTPEPPQVGDCQTDRQRTHRVLTDMRESAPLYASILECAEGLNGADRYGLEYRDDKRGKRYVLRDAQAVADALGVSVASARNGWKRGSADFMARWLTAFGAREDARERQPLTEKGAALIEAVKSENHAVFLRNHGRYVEFVHINSELDAVCTWTTWSRAVQLGILAA